jgi:hypothetical protein
MNHSRRGFFGFFSVPWLRRRRLEDARPTVCVELDRFFVAGVRHHAPELVPQLTVGLELQLAPEPDNPHDPCAVAIHFAGWRIGYVPRERNKTISRLLDQRVVAACCVVAVNRAAELWESVEVSVVIPCHTDHS